MDPNTTGEEELDVAPSSPSVHPTPGVGLKGDAGLGDSGSHS